MDFVLFMMCIFLFGVGCYGNYWYVFFRSSFDRVGNCDIVGIGSEILLYFRCGSRNI